MLLLILAACGRKEKPLISFYYWKTVFKLSSTERNALAGNGVKRLYIRYFDIALKPQTLKPVPVSPIHFEQKPEKFDIVPVIYIRNEVFLQKGINVPDLAHKVLDFLFQINKANDISCREIQIDCDWSLNSRDNYMAFLKVFRKKSEKKLSVTIRLHQVKYFVLTKVPAADRGVLMYYNMGKIAPDSLNSIYDRKIAGAYLGKLKKYPLPLNIALPVYNWGVHIRDRKVMRLSNKLNVSGLKKDTNFVSMPNGWFRVRRGNFRYGEFYRIGDLIKPESVSAEQLLEMAEDIEDHLDETPREIIFYDLDESNLKNYDKSLFKEIADRF